MSSMETPRPIGSGFDGDPVPVVDEDPQLAPPTAAERSNTLQSLREQLTKQLTDEVEFKPLTLEVVARPGVSVTYGTELDAEQFTAFRKRAKRKDHPDGVDANLLYAIVLAHLCESINMNGVAVYGDDGGVWNAKHPDVKRLFNVPVGGQASAVMKAVIGKDPHVLAHGQRVLEECGYGDEAAEMEEGPTPTS